MGVGQGDACPFCGGVSRPVFNASDWNQRSTTKSFAYSRCQDCRLIFQHPLPESLSEFYVHEQYDIPDTSDDFEPRAATQAWKLDLLPSFTAGSRMLEVGPATGEFATVARSAGFKVTLIEMDPECCTYLRDVLKHDVIESANPAASIPDEKFDIICVWQAIEHIPSFWALIELAARHLKSGGILAMSTPNPDAFQARLLGQYWPHLDAPRHLYLIPPAWYNGLSARMGLRVRSLTTRDVGSVGLNYYGWFLWVRNWPGRFISPERIGRWAAKLTNMFSSRELKEGSGASYVVLLEKV